MKVIDLLNKIANGEEVPKKFKYDDKIFDYDELIEEYFYEHYTFNYYYDLTDKDALNEEVEIIEDTPKKDKKIEKIKSLNKVGSLKDIIELGDKQQLNNHILKNKINEIIDKINGE